MSNTTIFGRAVNRKFIRAEQCGDWRFLDHHQVYGCSAKMKDWRSEVAVIIHEVIEALLCQEVGISDAQVTKFDEKFEWERGRGEHGDLEEAGDDPRAPYREQHKKATNVERSVVKALGLDWNEHEKNIFEKKGR